jgi:serine/threonine protein kinase
MLVTNSCPDAASLRRYLLGDTPPPDAEAVEQHLATCPQCMQRLEGMRADDSLTLDLRAVAVEQKSDSPEVLQLIQRLSRLGALPSEQATLAIDGSTPSEVPTAAGQVLDSRDQTQEGFNFLKPAQQPDEMGRMDGYRILRVLGTGGMGVVFEAEDVALGRRVALKVMRSELAMNPAARKRFLREARAMAAATHITNHDHVVTIHAVGEADGIPYISMPLLRGETLDDRLKREPRLPVPEVVRIGREIALGLAAAHEQGLVHRDIKPSNVWLEAKTDRVKIMDFGLARVPADTDQNLTQEGAIVGTPTFMAPEQARGEAIDSRCDLFSLGSVLYRAATGELPFKGKDSVSTLLAVASERPRPPQALNPDVPQVLSNLIMWLLTRDPVGRPASAHAVADALANLDQPIADMPKAAPDESSTTQVLPKPQTVGSATGRSKRSSRRWLAAAVALVMFLLFCMANLFNLPTLWRVVTYTGGLVIETDEPVVELTVRDQAGITQLRQLRGDQRQVDLAPGRYLIDVLLGERDGQPFGFTTEVTIGLGRTTVVDGHEGSRLLNNSAHLQEWRRESAEEIEKLRLEKLGRPPVVLTDRDKPFVTVHTEGGLAAFNSYKEFNEALIHTKDGDRIEVYGNGPFTVAPINLRDRGLDLRAGAGYRPVLLMSGTIEVHDHAVRIEGCDLHAAVGTRLLDCRRGPCVLRNCRIWQPTLDSRVIDYQGRDFEMTDCMVQAPDATVLTWYGEQSKGGKAELRNNLILSNSHSCVMLRGPGGQALHLDDNTILAGTKSGAIFLAQGLTEQVTIRAEGNLFTTTLFQDLPTDRVKFLSWQSRENLYSSRVPIAIVSVPGQKAADVYDLARWNNFAKEQGSDEFDAVQFQWSDPREEHAGRPLVSMNEIVKFMKRRAGQLRAAHPDDFPKNCGPDWNLVGPGDAYVNALATKDGPLPKEQIRPPGLGDAIVIVRRGNVTHSFDDLQQALDGARDGDVIEVRTDNKLPACIVRSKNDKRQITIRATPGYRPFFGGRDGGLSVEGGNTVTVEGFHFQDGALWCVMDDHGRGGRIARVANCSFGGTPPAGSHSAHICGGMGKGFGPAAGPQVEDLSMEIVNCLTTAHVFVAVQPKSKVVIRNSIIGGVHVDNQYGETARVEIRRSLMWPDTYLGPDLSGVEAVRISGNAASKLDVVVEQSLLDTPTLLAAPDIGQIGSWHGSGNVYCAAGHNWLRVDGKQDFIGDLKTWRDKWHSDEKGSIVAEPLLDDPRMWSLLEGSPGYHARPSGKDYGAEVTRIGVPTKK